ncbi:MAG TPA: glycosyltransferase family 4 protein [Vicinamibacterales bacterium]
MSAPRRLLTIGHSYVVAANRRLAHEMAVQSGGSWEVTAIAPARYRADLGRMAVQPIAGEASRLAPLDVRLDRIPHLMWYASLGRILDAPWDVVHCWEEPYVLAGAQVARRTPRGARLVVASFQNLAKQYPWPLSAFEDTTMARADGWIAFGQSVHDTLAPRRGYAGKPSRVIPPGVDIARFRPDEAARRRTLDRLGWTSTDRIVGFLGRFVPEKGIAVLLDALRGVTTPWRALFVGGGPMQDALQRFAAGHPGRVHIQTGVAHDQVPSWLNAMTLLCAPSQTTPGWREQFGRMLIEAMACGVPVVASDSGEMPSVVGEAGVVLPERDVAAWTTAIDGLVGDDAVLRDHSARGIARANACFAWPVVARAHLDFFEALTEGRPA